MNYNSGDCSTDTLERLRQSQNYRSWKFEYPANWDEAEAAPRGRRFPLGEGPWNDEPDKVQWIDPATDLDCLALRNPMGAWCGYVGLPPEHPLHGKDYGKPDVDVHGGLTFANFCADSEDPEEICHVAAPGRPDHVWWFGFDCSHAFDLQPGMRTFERRMGLNEPPFRLQFVYRDLAYVVDQVTQLAAQLREPGMSEGR